jgi:hypothetical protein
VNVADRGEFGEDAGLVSCGIAWFGVGDGYVDLVAGAVRAEMKIWPPSG